MKPIKSLCGHTFATTIIEWQRLHGRHDLPWQNTGNPYAVWVSEIMLQQTQVHTAIAYYQRFMKRFPSVESLASASLDETLNHWAGLGYYSRARNLHKAANMIMQLHQGRLPTSLCELQTLPGIGRSTAGAIMALAHHKPAAILDGNVRRVFCRYYGLEGVPTESRMLGKLWDIAEHNAQNDSPATYTQGLMDMGATCCKPKQPNCTQCPLQNSCQAAQLGLQYTLPTKPKPKAKPEIHLVTLWLHNGLGGALLQQLHKGFEGRIWQGLWMPPMWILPKPTWERNLNQDEVKPLLDNIDWEKFGIKPKTTEISKWMTIAKNLENIQPLKHVLTHKTLWIKPVLIEIPKHHHVQCRNLDDVATPSVLQAINVRLAKP